MGLSGREVMRDGPLTVASGAQRIAAGRKSPGTASGTDGSLFASMTLDLPAPIVEYMSIETSDRTGATQINQRGE
jgi:hypothetical protein